METTALNPSFLSAIQFLLPAILAALSVLGAEAYKYVNTPLWDTDVFIKSNLLPFGLTVALSLAVYFILVYLPVLKPVLEDVTGQQIIITSAGIFGFAQACIKGFLQKKKTVEEIKVIDPEAALY